MISNIEHLARQVEQGYCLQEAAHQLRWMETQISMYGKWQSLTDDEIYDIDEQTEMYDVIAFAHVLEAKLKEKNRGA